MDLNGVFSTFIETDGDSSPETSPEASQALAQAVRRCRTCVTRGPVLHWILDGDSLKLSLCPGLTPIPEQGPEAPPPFFCLIKTEKDSLRIPLGNGDCLVSLPDTIRSSRGAALSGRDLHLRAAGALFLNGSSRACFFLNLNAKEPDHLFGVRPPFGLTPPASQPGRWPASAWECGSSYCFQTQRLPCRLSYQ